MADGHSLRRVGLVFGAVTALVAMMAVTTLVRATQASLQPGLQTEARAAVAD